MRVGFLDWAKIFKVACGDSNIAVITEEGQGEVFLTWGKGLNGSLGHGDDIILMRSGGIR